MKAYRFIIPIVFIIIAFIPIGNQLFKDERFKHKYIIEQGYLHSEYWTWVWYSGNIVHSWFIVNDSISCEKIQSDRIKAEQWINKVNCK